MTTPDTQPEIDEAKRDALLSCLAAYDRVLLAVSGGSDSVALMVLVAEWALARRSAGLPVPLISAATVDHHLRPESAAEADFVARTAQGYGLDHACLHWTHEKPTAGVQAAARAARYGLLGGHLEQIAPGVKRALVTAHTQDDQAETVLMRLARGSSLDGVAGMRKTRQLAPLDPTDLLRPLLTTTRKELRSCLTERGKHWIDDPSNEDTAFERIRLRKLQPALDAAGLDAASIAGTANRLAEERDALDQLTSDWLSTHLTAYRQGLWGSVFLSPFRKLPPALAVRVLRRIMDAFGGKPEPVSLTVAEDLRARLVNGPSGHQETAGRCLLRLEAEQLWIAREPPRALIVPVEFDSRCVRIWDNRLRIECPQTPAWRLRVTSEASATGLPEVERPSEVPREIWMAASSTAPVMLAQATEPQSQETLLWRALEAKSFDATVPVPRPLVLQHEMPSDRRILPVIRLSARRLKAPDLNPMSTRDRLL